MIFNFKNATIVGTSHISREAVREIKKVVSEKEPSIIGLELDRRRLSALVRKFEHGKDERLGFFEGIRTLGAKAYLIYAVIAFVEKFLGGKIDVFPGEDMYAGYKEAKKHGCRLALIDRNVEVTLKRLSKAFTFRVFVRMAGEFVAGLFMFLGEKLGFKGKQKKGVELDLNKVPEKETIDFMVSEVRKKYPSLYKALISERDRYMANNILKLMKDYPEEKLVFVVGAGHLEGIKGILEKGFWKRDLKGSKLFK